MTPRETLFIRFSIPILMHKAESGLSQLSANYPFLCTQYPCNPIMVCILVWLFLVLFWWVNHILLLPVFSLTDLIFIELSFLVSPNIPVTFVFLFPTPACLFSCLSVSLPFFIHFISSHLPTFVCLLLGIDCLVLLSEPFCLHS